jgi:ribulose-5-phosphate 4-epimerase/fuculose-1-phosphate aldolase
VSAPAVRPTASALLPPLTPRQELVLLARTLWREGYDDHLAGHITYRQPDGTLLCNPWLLLCIPLHLELHRQRGDVTVAVHSHPRYGTIWADRRLVPGCYDQSSALGGGELVVVDEYDGPVDDRESAARAVRAMGTADMALLANHGVFVTAGSIRAAHQRAVALEYRSRRAWEVEAVGGGRELPEPARSFFRSSDGEGFVGYFEAMARQELRLDPTLVGPA